MVCFLRANVQTIRETAKHFLQKIWLIRKKGLSLQTVKQNGENEDSDLGEQSGFFLFC